MELHVFQKQGSGDWAAVDGAEAEALLETNGVVAVKVCQKVCGAPVKSVADWRVRWRGKSRIQERTVGA